MRKTLLVTAALVGLTAATGGDAQAQGSIADILSGRTTSQRYDAVPRDPVAPILRYKRELNLSRSQENRLRDIQKDLKRRNDDLEKRIRRYDDDRRRDSRGGPYDGRYDRRDDHRYDGRYDNRRDNDYGRSSREYEAAIRQMRLNSERAWQSARRVLSPQQQRRLDSLYRYDDRYGYDGRYDDGRYGDGRATGRVYR